ncbi:hypothetical protein GN958_ATG15808 [Phytophthora infestans]|uniref:Uncharacterized protein n=1 Tax=Phytophthora infestans TaxID=4787 RepID=A0A8S9U207_PHYIN|nr:hypothetical protein GN958_ATG16155 [Phytophthora infestans]KAF4134992.1 hypothetical protein GN958_ATG15808 [Phytophthora infestans]
MYLLEFVKSLAAEFEARRERESREHLDGEERIQARVVALQEQQAKIHQQVEDMMAAAMQTLVTVLGNASNANIN